MKKTQIIFNVLGTLFVAVYDTKPTNCKRVVTVGAVLLDDGKIQVGEDGIYKSDGLGTFTQHGERIRGFIELVAKDWTANKLTELETAEANAEA